MHCVGTAREQSTLTDKLLFEMFVLFCPYRTICVYVSPSHEKKSSWKAERSWLPPLFHVTGKEQIGVGAGPWPLSGLSGVSGGSLSTLSYGSSKPEKPVWGCFEFLGFLPSVQCSAGCDKVMLRCVPGAPQGWERVSCCWVPPCPGWQFSGTDFIRLSLNLKAAEPPALVKLLNPFQYFPCMPTLHAVMA